MNTSYDAWAKFDVDEELARVDERAEREAQEKQAQAQRQAKRAAEDSLSKSSGDAAEVLAAQAAVAALKAKKRGKRPPTTASLAATPNGERSLNEPGDDEASRLRAQADLLRKKHELLEQILKARRDGDAKLQSKETATVDHHKAMELYQTALKATQTLDGLVPELVRVQKEQDGVRESLDPADSKATESGHTAECNDPVRESCSHGSHGHHHEHGHNNKEQKSRIPKDAGVPQVNDLSAVVGMFYKDIYYGIASCHVLAGKLAAASDAFKEVLVRDGTHVQAWIQRGKTFESMGAPLLAMLHYNRVTTLDPANEDGSQALEAMKEQIFAFEAIDAAQVDRDIRLRTDGESVGSIVASTLELYEQANVVMVEGFHGYAMTKFKTILGCVDFLRQRQDFNDLPNDLDVADMLRELEISCNLNIASGYLEMQRDFSAGLACCERVLRLDPSNAVCHYRMGQILRSTHKYDKALHHLDLARQLCLDGQASASLSKAIAKETDKTQFERSQNDLAHIRSLVRNEKAVST